MVRGTFANVRLKPTSPRHRGGRHPRVPTARSCKSRGLGEVRGRGRALVILAGKEYGSGSSRDWAAKGPRLLGVRVVIAESYERIHRSNLVGMGIVPLQFAAGETAASLGLTGEEVYETVGLPALLESGLRAGPRADRARDRRRRQGQGAPHDRAHRYAAGDRLLPARRHPALRAAPARALIVVAGRGQRARRRSAAPVAPHAAIEPLDDPSRRRLPLPTMTSGFGVSRPLSSFGDAGPARASAGTPTESDVASKQRASRACVRASLDSIRRRAGTIRDRSATRSGCVTLATARGRRGGRCKTWRDAARAVVALLAALAAGARLRAPRAGARRGARARCRRRAPDGRLPRQVHPTRYALELAVDPSKPTFTGHTRITIGDRRIHARDRAARPWPHDSLRPRSPRRPASSPATGRAAAGSKERPPRSSWSRSLGRGAGRPSSVRLVGASRRASRPLPRRGGRTLVRVHAVRAHRRAPGVPVLRRARLQDAVRRSRSRPAGTVALANTPEVARRRRTARGPFGSRRRRRCPRTSSRSPSAPFDVRDGHGEHAARSASSRRGQGARHGALGDGRGAARRARGLLRPPVSRTRSSTSSRCPIRRRRDGERGPHHVPRGAPAARRPRVVGGAPAQRGRRARARAPVVRRSRHDGVVGRHLAQRGVRDWMGDRSSTPGSPSGARLQALGARRAPWTTTRWRPRAASASPVRNTSDARRRSTPSRTRRAAPCSR